MAPSLTVGRPADAAAADKDASAQGANVLYLPATSRDRTAVGDRLTRTGVAVTAVPDVTDAVRLLASRRFALCVVDLADDRAAIGAIRVLRSRHAHQPIAAIIDPANPLVAGEANDVHLRIMNNGATPFDGDVVIATPLNWLSEPAR